MGMKGLIYEILADKQKEIIKSLESQIKNKNETILKETQRANEMFKLSYNRKLKIEEQQAEINRLREAINSALNFMACPDDLSELTGKCNDQAAFDVLREALNNEREG